MVLNFFGRGSGYADEHTSAYFTTDINEMVIIDCPTSTFEKLKKMDLSSYEDIYVLVTHTHGDHIGSLGRLVEYAYSTLKKRIFIVAPSKEVSEDLARLMQIQRKEQSWYHLLVADDLWECDWYITVYLTEHSPQLVGKCYGYHLLVGDIDVVYTGDTSTLEPFSHITDLLDEGNMEFYVDVSVHYDHIHLKLEDALEQLVALTNRGVKVYLMHLDDIEAAEEIIKDIPNIEVVPVV